VHSFSAARFSDFSKNEEHFHTAEGISGKHELCFRKWSEVLNFINLDESDLKTAAYGLPEGMPVAKAQ
jgi:hypothetical protein